MSNNPITKLREAVNGLAKLVVYYQTERDELRREVRLHKEISDGYAEESHRYRRVLEQIDEEYHWIIVEPDPDAGQHIEGCVGCFAHTALASNKDRNGS